MKRGGKREIFHIDRRAVGAYTVVQVHEIDQRESYRPEYQGDDDSPDSFFVEIRHAVFHREHENARHHDEQGNACPDGATDECPCQEKIMVVTELGDKGIARMRKYH